MKKNGNAFPPSALRPPFALDIVAAMADSAERFSGRVADYLKYRPGYPEELLVFLGQECGLVPGSVVADVGSGTGKLAELFLSGGNTVFGIEPNEEMRLAAERLFCGRGGFHSVAGRAEATTLPDASVDMVAVGQAFHWFDREKAAVEFRRILRPDGFAVIVWNARELSGSSPRAGVRRKEWIVVCAKGAHGVEPRPWADAYEDFLRAYSIDYLDAAHHNDLPEEDFGRFFAGPYGVRSFPNRNSADFDALLGRYLSVSYALTRDHPCFKEAKEMLRSLFHAYERGGLVDFSYRTQAYFGRLAREASL